jgi:hypothetical protein
MKNVEEYFASVSGEEDWSPLQHRPHTACPSYSPE